VVATAAVAAALEVICHSCREPRLCVLYLFTALLFFSNYKGQKREEGGRNLGWLW